MKAIFRFAALGACVAGLAFSARAQESFAPLVEKLSPAVVNISTTQLIELSESPLGNLFPYEFPKNHPFHNLPELLDRFYGGGTEEGGVEKRKTTSLGSGFIISPEGYIATNYHVIEKAEEIMVTFHDDAQAEATIVGTDEKTDIALLKVSVERPLPYAEWGKSDDAKVGDWVIAIGNPFGLGGSVSAGIISARARDINSGPFDDYIQTDAAINRGNSGGPMFNVDGKVIGLNTAIFSPSGGNVGIGFAVPSSLAEPVVKQLREYGKAKRGWLGVKIQQVSEEIARSLGMKKPTGALVIEVTPESPAGKAGVKSGDVILSFDGNDVTEMRRLPRMVADTPLQKKVDMEVWRDEKELSLSVKIGEMKDDEKEAKPRSAQGKDKEKPDSAAVSVLGMKLAAIDDSVRERFELEEGINGLLVTDVEDGSAAQEQGIRRLDVILSVDRQDVATPGEMERLVAVARKHGKPALLMVRRAGSPIFIAIPTK
jgi:serine protease Do